MPKWEVSYRTETEPKNLPTGASVARISEYPVTFASGAARLDVHRIPATVGALKDNLVASLKVNGRPIALDEDQAREVAEALLKLADDRKAHLAERAAEQAALKAEAQRIAAHVRNAFTATYPRPTWRRA
ncbi:MAG: hypothetical protein ABIQ18_39770 [Umezawaea sp.]